jgi:hypothetical protein
VQTAHGDTRPLNHPTTKYPTCATIPDHLHQVSYSSSLHAMPHLPSAHHETNKQRQRKNKRKLFRIRIQTSPSQWLITIKPRNWPLCFSISPLMNPLTTKAQSLKFESKIPWNTARRPKKPRKAQACHLEEGKPQKPIKGKKSGKAKQNGKEELRRARKTQTQDKRSKCTKAQNQLPLTLSMQALPLR